jgi:HPt (histidine-containing phosphotransfer) domain-containing protein
VLNVQHALACVGGDETLLQEVAGIFFQDCSRLVRGVRDAVAAGDARKLRMYAHTLKGSVGHFGAAEAEELADRLQILGMESNLADAADLVDALEKELERITPTLAAWATGAVRSV